MDHKKPCFRRRWFTIFSTLSLFLCIATVVLSVWSYGTRYEFVHAAFNDAGAFFSQGFTTDSGTLKIGFDRPPYIDPQDIGHPSVSWFRLKRKPEETRWWGYDFVNEGEYILFPVWLPAILFAIAPALWLLSFFRRKRRLAINLCPVCGYDLRASPGRCPECGAQHPAPRTH